MATVVYDIITSRIMEKLEQGTVPWQQPWNSAAGMPRNLLSQKAYRGINVWVLVSAGAALWCLDTAGGSCCLGLSGRGAFPRFRASPASGVASLGGLVAGSAGRWAGCARN